MVRIAPTRTSDRRLLIAGACAALLGVLIASATLVWPAPADSAALRFKVLGKRVNTLPPDCPGTENKGCQGIGRVTGYQSISKGSRNQPYEVPWRGKLVSWSITLSKPRNNTGPEENKTDEVAFFNEYFGKPSQARISVLRRVRGTRPKQYRLVRQSPIQVLNPYFGSTVEFALEHPLTVLKGHMVAITIPTWAPAFFHAAACEPLPYAPTVLRDEARCEQFSAANAWRGSRRKGRCQFNGDTPEELHAQVDKSFPQQRVGSKKEYGCYYRGARLLYTATIVKQPVNTGGGGGGGGGGDGRATASESVAPDDNGVGANSEVTP